MGHFGRQALRTICWEKGVPQSKTGVLLPAEVLVGEGSLKPQAVKLGIIANFSMPWSCMAPTKSCVWWDLEKYERPSTDNALETTER